MVGTSDLALLMFHSAASMEFGTRWCGSVAFYLQASQGRRLREAWGGVRILIGFSTLWYHCLKTAGKNLDK
jgi:hypothetical protein